MGGEDREIEDELKSEQLTLRKRESLKGTKKKGRKRKIDKEREREKINEVFFLNAKCVSYCVPQSVSLSKYLST